MESKDEGGASGASRPRLRGAVRVGGGSGELIRAASLLRSRHTSQSGARRLGPAPARPRAGAAPGIAVLSNHSQHMYCTDCYTTVEDGHDSCPRCGATLSEQDQLFGGAAGASDGTEARGGPASGAVSLDEAVAVTVVCPHCEERPVEEVAKGARVIGFLVAHHWETRRVMGCHRCVRSTLWGLAGKTVLLGWWSVGGVFLTPFFVLWNVLRGAYNRGPNRHLVEMLEEEHRPFSLLADRRSYDVDRWHRLEGHVRTFARLGVAVAQADGTVSTDEREAIRRCLGQLFPNYPRSEIDRRIQQVSSGDPEAATVASGLASTLTLSWKREALKMVRWVVEAGTPDGAKPDTGIVYEIGAHLNVDEAEVATVL